MTTPDTPKPEKHLITAMAEVDAEARRLQRETDAALVEATENWIQSFLLENAPYKSDAQSAWEIATYIAAKIREGRS